jgi:hypothetical protein
MKMPTYDMPEPWPWHALEKPNRFLALSSHPSRALRIAAVVALRRMSHPGIARFLNDSDEFIVTEAARAINDDLSIKDALPALGNLLNTTPLYKRSAAAARHQRKPTGGQ